MVKCCVEGCGANSKYSGPTVTFHRFPDARCFPFLFQKWLHKVTGVPYDQPVDFAVLSTYRVCSLHFTENDFVVKTDKNRTRRTLKVDALLSQKLPLNSSTDATEPFAIRNSDNGSFKNFSMMCINNNQDLSSHSKRRLYNGHDLTITKIPKKMKIVKPGIISRNGQVQAGHYPVEGTNPPQRATYSSPRRECNNTPHPATNLTPVRECNTTPQRATNLTPVRECNKTPQRAKYLNPKTEYDEELEANIPACYRVKEPVYSPFALSITRLEPEFGFDVIVVNDNKYIKCDPADGDSQIWRCIIKSCSGCIVTSSVHWSIVFSLRGDHYHFPSIGFLLDPSEWVLGTPQTPPWLVQHHERPQSDGKSPGFGRDSGCEKSLVEGDMSPWGGQHTVNSPPQPQPDTQFNPTGLLAPNISQLQLLYSQHHPLTLAYPQLSSLEALSKFCGGQVIERNPLAGSQSTSFALTTNENAISGSYPQIVVAAPEPHPVMVTAGSMTPEKEVEYILPSPASVRTNADEPCEDSSSGRASILTEEPVYYELIDGDAHDVQNAQDPLSLDKDSQQKAFGNRYPTTPKGELPKEYDFSRTFGPRLNRLSAQDKNVFKEQVIGNCTDYEK